MRSPTNTILTGLAIADLLVMTDYVPFNVHNNIQNLPESERLTLVWAYIALLHMHVSIVFHTISCWLTILLAVWRYLAVSFPTQTKTWLTLNKSVICIILIYIIVPIYCIPCYLSFTVFAEESRDGNRTLSTIYRVEWSDMASNNSFLKHLNIWVFGVGSKMVPCVLLTYLSFSLISVLIEADKRKRRLHNRKPPSIKAKNNQPPAVNHAGQKMLSTSVSSSTNFQIEGSVQGSVEMAVVSRALEQRQTNGNDKCLTIKPTNQLLKTDHLESSVTLPVSSDPTTTDQTTAYSNAEETNFDCNNNLGSARDNGGQRTGQSTADPSNTNHSQIENQPLSVHDGSMTSSKEHLNSPMIDQKRNSVSSVSRQSALTVPQARKSIPAIDLSSRKPQNTNNKLATPTVVSSSTPVQSSSVYIQSSQSDRTTRMLISVLLIFLLCEFPSGILILLSSIIGESFFNDIYLPLGNIIDLLALVNSSINFILYCTMSKQFRRTFSKLILRRKREELSGVTKFKSNRKHKKKSSLNKKKPDKKSNNNHNAKQQNPSEYVEDKSAVFVTSKC